MAPGGPRATVVSASGGLYRLSGGALEAGAAIGEQERIRTGPGAHAALRLADGSTVDVNERTELFVTAAWSGQAIHLQRGDVIVQAAKQRRGHLRVLTRDSIASVKGTVFAVSAGHGRIGGLGRRRIGGRESARAGRAAQPRPAGRVQSRRWRRRWPQAVAWSPDAEQYLQLLASFATIERQMAPFLESGAHHLGPALVSSGWSVRLRRRAQSSAERSARAWPRRSSRHSRTPRFGPGGALTADWS